MPVIRLLCRLLLVLAVGLASVHSGIGRAEAAGAIRMEICAQGTVQTVTIGADGRPVTHLYPCPDCVLGGMAALPSPAMLALPPAVPMLALLHEAGAVGHPLCHPPHARARGPPSAV
ncbi:hypothetical protein [Neotabrizicola sp. VNH66]|uniref:hypothetical protein n=1 Tax=Neotabrizicola sp. VNH66 TaxID=3400918 RepID=UPI003C05248B